MDIAEMHVWFRQYAQQMGMQNTRAILPEQIDLVINTSITDVVNQVITQNIGATNDRIITDNSKIGQINALRSLYKVLVIDMADPYNVGIFNEGDETTITRLWAKLDCMVAPARFWTIAIKEPDQMVARPISREAFNQVEESSKIEGWHTFAELAEKYLIPANNLKAAKTLEPFKYMYLVDLALNYTSNDKKTNYFPVRLIDDIYLADTLNDFLLAPRLRSPIAVIYNNQLDLYIDTPANIAARSIEPKELRISYIAKPALVKYQSDIGGEDVNCDLPDYMHVDILKHAVDLYRVAVSSGMYGAQQQQQAQNREIARNTARPDNEGYQS